MLADKERWEDYYSILQVHQRADLDIVTSAYRRLCKRYHPDINKGANSARMMQRVNAAYEVLADSRKRATYDIEWARRNGAGAGTGFGAGASVGARTGAGAGARTGFGAAAGAAGARSAPNRPGESQARKGRDQRSADDEAALALHKYFAHIKNNDFAAAYGCISAYDKRRIAESDFVRWQSAVNGAIELREVDISLFRRCPGGAVGSRMFDEAFEYTVRICERERSKGGISEYLSSKKVVRDGSVWGVYLGYRSVKPFISRFMRAASTHAPASASGGANLSDDERERLTAKAQERTWLHGAAHDELTGLPNLQGLASTAKREASRCRRNGNVFSLAAFEASSASVNEGALAMLLGGLLADTLRVTDAAGRWKGARFVAVLPETKLGSAKKAVNRVCASFNRLMLERAQGSGYRGDPDAGAGAGRNGTGAARNEAGTGRNGAGAGAGRNGAGASRYEAGESGDERRTAPMPDYALYAGVYEYDGSTFKSMLTKCMRRVAVARRARCLRAVAGAGAKLRRSAFKKVVRVHI